MKKFLWVICGFALIIVVILFAFNNQKADLQSQITALESDNAALSQKMTDDAAAASASAQAALDEAVAAKDAELETLRQENADALAAAETDKQTAIDEAVKAAKEEAEADKQAAIDEAVKAAKEEAEAIARANAEDTAAAAQAAQEAAVKAAQEAAEADKQAAIDEAVKAAQEAAEADKQAAIDAAVAPLNEQIASLTAQLEEVSLRDVITREEHVAALNEAVEQAKQEAETKLQAAKAEWDATMEAAKQEWEATKDEIAEKAKEGLYTLEQVNETVTQKVEDALRLHGILRDDETSSEAQSSKIALPSLESYLEAVLGADFTSAAPDAQVACVLCYFNDVLPAAGFGEPEITMGENGFTVSLTGVVTCTVTFADGTASITTEYGEGVEVSAYDGEVSDITKILEDHAEAVAELLPAA